MIGSRLALGCMRINGLDEKGLEAHIQNALEVGINFFDHADIYGGGSCEELFGKAVKRLGIDRESMFVQSKCTIRNGYYDASKEHILNSVDGILKRLDMDYIDVLLLHRPDTLMEPEEIAEAFDVLETSGKVRSFGVSNHNPMQIELIKTCVKQPLVINQLQFGIAHTGIVDSGINVNTTFNGAFDKDGSVLEYSRINKMTIQPWSPFQFGFFGGVVIDNPEYKELNDLLNKMSEEKGTTPSALIVAWILRHPANMQPIIGSTNKDRITEIATAMNVELSKQEWYEIYRAAGNTIP